MLKHFGIREIYRLVASGSIHCFNVIKKGSQIEWLRVLCFYSAYRNKEKLNIVKTTP